MKHLDHFLTMGAMIGLLLAPVPGRAAEETVATAVYARVAKDYKRELRADGSFKPEFYGLANGGRIAGTGSDLTVDRVTYPEVAQIAARLLAQKNYHYAQSAKQADLMIVLHWGTTIAFNSGNYATQVNSTASAMANLKALTAGGVVPQSGASYGGPISTGSSAGAAAQAAVDVFEAEILKLLMENRARDRINEDNARVLGYMDDLNDSNDIRRWAGGGDRYNDLIADVEESRYYIIVSAYDFDQLVNHQKKVLRWQTRVSVRAPGNRFDDSFAAMLKGASKYFGQDSGRLMRGEESKGTVELGDLKFLGEEKEPARSEKRK